MKKRLLAILTVLALVLGMVPAAAATEPGETVTVSYVNASGNEATAEAILLTGDEPRVFDGVDTDYVVLGRQNQATWYAVTEDLLYAAEENPLKLSLLGYVAIILCDGASLTVQGEIEKDADATSTTPLAFYGQTGQTGSMRARGILDVEMLDVSGGKLSVDMAAGFDQITLRRGRLEAYSLSAGNLNMTGGTLDTGRAELGGSMTVSGGTARFSNRLSAKAVSFSNAVVTGKTVDALALTVNGGSLRTSGSVTAAERASLIGGQIYVRGQLSTADLTLGCADEEGRITVGSYEMIAQGSHWGDLRVAEGQTLVDGHRSYTGELYCAGGWSEAEYMEGRTLMLAHPHLPEELPHCEGVLPSYDPETGVYTDGNLEYWSCPTCGGCLIRNESTQELEYTEPDKLAPDGIILPYFAYSMGGTYEGGRVSYLSGYYGADPEIIIPDYVPDNYFDEAQRGNLVMYVNHNAFRNNTVITSVTMGDAIAEIWVESFRGCTNLSSVRLGSGLTSLSSGAFRDCSALTEFTAGDRLSYIGESAFRDCGALAAVTIGSGLAYVAENAFLNCTALEDFTSTSMQSITDYDDEEGFDYNSDITFHGFHGSALLEISQRRENWSFRPLDRHVEPVWTWAADLRSATARFDCGGTCLLEPCELTDSEIEIVQSEIGTVYTASVTLDGEEYVDTITDSWWSRLQAQIDAVPENSSAVIVLERDYFAAASDTALMIPAGKVITFVMQDHVIDRNLTEAEENGCAIVVENGATLVLEGPGTVTGGYNTGVGGGVVLNGSLVMRGSAAISGNRSEQGGGGLAVTPSGRLEMASGAITDNYGASNGGGVYNVGTMILRGGSITGNRTGASGEGGGIMNVGTLTVSGQVAVTDNVAGNGSNVYLLPNNTGGVLRIDGPLDAGSRIGVFQPGAWSQPTVFTAGLPGNGTPENFFSDMPESFFIRANEAGEAVLYRSFEFIFYPNYPNGGGEPQTLLSQTNELELPPCFFTAPEGARFKAWSVNGTERQPGETVSVSSGYAIAILALWQYPHSVTIDPHEHGSGVAVPASAFAGTEIRVEVTPEEGYLFAGLRVRDHHANLIHSEGNSFIMPDEDVTVFLMFGRSIDYIDADGTPRTAVAANAAEYWELVSGFYYLEGDNQMNWLAVLEDAKLILCDGSRTVCGNPGQGQSGIELWPNSSLSIYGQENGTGVLSSAKAGDALIGPETLTENTRVKLNGGVLEGVGWDFVRASEITVSRGSCANMILQAVDRLDVAGGAIAADFSGLDGINASYVLDAPAGRLDFRGGSLSVRGPVGGICADSASIQGGQIDIDPTQGDGIRASTLTLGWTSESAPTMRVRANSYVGSLTFYKPFKNLEDPTEVFPGGPFSELSLLAGKTLVPFDLADGFYLIGPDGWTLGAIDAEKRFVRSPIPEQDEYALETTLRAGDPLKVVRVTGGGIMGWYPGEAAEPYVVDPAHAGEKTVLFSESYREDWAEFGGYIWIDATGVPYVDAAGEPQTPIESYSLIDADTETLSPGWWIVSGEVANDHRLIVSGEVNLILCDGASLTASRGIRVSKNNSLTIWAQSQAEGRGKLTARTKTSDHAAIGSDASGIGTIVINGGEIDASAAGGYGAGIGGGIHSGDGTVIIRNGKVTAQGGSYGAGIGGGYNTWAGNYGSIDSVIITGGEVTATGGNGAAGIGGCGATAATAKAGSVGDVTITGGKVVATGGNANAYGIGPGVHNMSSGTNGTVVRTIVFGWTEESRDGMELRASRYWNEITLEKPFRNLEDPDETFPEGPVSDAGALANKTLIPYEEAPAEPIETSALRVFSSISVGTDMIVTFSVRKTDVASCEKFWIEVVKHAPEGDVVYTYGAEQEAPLNESASTWQIDFNHIFAKEMGLDVEARVYAEDASGQIYMSPARTTNIRDYLGGRLTATNNSVAQRVLAADLLNYGAAAQLFMDYETDHLVNEELSAEELAKLEEYETKELPLVEKTNSNYRPEGQSNILFNSVSLDNEVILSLTVRYAEGSEVKVLMKDHETGTVLETLDTERVGSNYVVNYSGIGADKMRVAYDFTTQVNGVETGNIRTWSVEGYVGEIRAGTNQLKTDLANALLTYGDSAAAYFAAQ